MRLLPAGPAALLVEVGSAEHAAALYAAARAADLAVTDVVPGARSVLFDGVPDQEALTSWLRGHAPESVAFEPLTGRLVELPATYDGADLDDVARMWGMTRGEVVTTHTGIEFTVAFCGFSPGFAYCTGLPVELHVPRLESPRARVPAGSVGVAGEFTGVYPRASPGGWRLLGRTSATLWDLDADEPALLAPGTRVRFTAVTA